MNLNPHKKCNIYNYRGSLEGWNLLHYAVRRRRDTHSGGHQSVTCHRQTDHHFFTESKAELHSYTRISVLAIQLLFVAVTMETI